MPAIQGSLSIAANTTVENVLTGSQFEFLPYPSAVSFAVVGSAVGLLADINSGSDILTERMAVSGANRVPINPDDYILNDVADTSERLKIRVTNTTGGAITVNYGVIITPLGM